MAILQPSNNSRSRIKNAELPPKGRFIATCFEVEDQLRVERPKFESADIEVVDLTTFYFGFVCKEGRPWAVKTREMKISMHEKAALMKFLTGWLSKPPVAGFDTQSVVGFGAEIRVEHVASQRTPGRYFANLSVVLPVEDEDAKKVRPVATFEGLLHPLVKPTVETVADTDEIPF